MAAVLFTLWGHRGAQEEPVGPAAESAAGDILFEIQGKAFVGAAELLRTAQPQDAELLPHASELNTGSFRQRLRYVVLAGELGGPEDALKSLQELDQTVLQVQFEVPPLDAQLEADLKTLYTEYREKNWEAPALPEENRQQLTAELGWFGALALAPKEGPDRAARSTVIGPATRLAIVFVLGVVGVVLLGLAGAVGLAIVLVSIGLGWLRAGLSPPTGNGGIYMETFVVWMTLFLTLSEGLRFVLPGPDLRLLAISLTQLLSLVALAWPVFRGVPWSVVRNDIGLTWGRQPLLEPFLGVACYAMMLPMMFAGLMITVVLLSLSALFQAGGGPGDTFAPHELPSHPIITMFRGGAWWVPLQLIFTASIAAPFVEEIMFRGLLYRHLRDSSWRLGSVMSAVGSALLTSFIFALIHPQGLFAVPALMGVACGLTFAREWRQTLIPSMIAHAINNGLILLLLLVALS